MTDLIFQLESPRRRLQNRSHLISLAGLALALPALWSQEVFFEGSWDSYLVSTAVIFMVGAALLGFTQGLSGLHGLRRGGCVEELVGSGMGPQQLVDAVMWRGLRTFAWALPVWLVLEWATPKTGFLGLLLGCLVALATGSYAAQVKTITVVAALVPVVAFLAWEPQLVWLPLVASAAWCRRVAIDEFGDQAMVRGVSLAWWPQWVDSPIALRQLSRLSFGTALALLVPASVVLANPGSGAAQLVCLGLMVWGGCRTVSAVAGEREGRTFDVLVETGITPQEFYRDWVKAGGGPLVLAGFLAWLPLTQLWQGWVLLALVALLLSGPVGARLGLWASIRADGMRQAYQRLLLGGWLTVAGLASGWTAFLLVAFHFLKGGGGRFDTVLFDYSPLVCLVVAQLVWLCLAGRVEADLATVWRGEVLVPSHFVVAYFQQALAHGWSPGRLVWLPPVVAMAGELLDELRWTSSEEAPYLLAIVLGFGLLAGGLPWLLGHRWVNRAWAACRRFSVAWRVLGLQILGLAGAGVSLVALAFIIALTGGPDQICWGYGFAAGSLLAFQAAWTER